mgnify:CR=1 FL=1
MKASNPGQHSGTDLLVIVEGEHEIGPVRMREGAVGATLALDLPADPLEGSENASSLRSGPAAQAARNVTFRNSGGVSPYSSRSAITLRANA